LDIPKTYFAINYSQFDEIFSVWQVFLCLDVQYAFVNRNALISYARKDLNATNALFIVPPNATKATQSRLNTIVVMRHVVAKFSFGVNDVVPNLIV